MAAPALKNPKKVVRGILIYFFNPEVYPINFMPFFLDNILPILGIWGGEVPTWRHHCMSIAKAPFETGGEEMLAFGLYIFAYAKDPL